MVTLRRHRRASRLRDDGGFTLAEMLVVMALLGIAIGAAYMFLQAANAGQAVADREATLSRAVALPLQVMEKLIVQNSSIDPIATANYQLSPYQLRISTDRDGNDVLEQHTFTAVRDAATGQGYVDLVTYLTDSSGATVGAAQNSGHIAFDNANIRDSVPLFRYYDKDGVEITDMGAVSVQARSVTIQLAVTADGRTETHVDTVQFRNRTK